MKIPERFKKKHTTRMTGTLRPELVAAFNFGKRSRTIFERQTEEINGRKVCKMVPVRKLFKHPAR